MQGVPIRCVALSHYSSTQCYAVTGPAAVHDLDPRLFASYGDGSVPRPLLPPTAWMTVCSADGSPLEKCRPSATLSVSWSVPHVPFGDLLVLYDASCKHQTAFYQTDVPPLMASGTVLVRFSGAIPYVCDSNTCSLVTRRFACQSLTSFSSIVTRITYRFLEQIPAPAASGNYTLSYVLMGKAESSYSRMM